jgi:hypothetical protein
MKSSLWEVDKTKKSFIYKPKGALLIFEAAVLIIMFKNSFVDQVFVLLPSWRPYQTLCIAWRVLRMATLLIGGYCAEVKNILTAN